VRGLRSALLALAVAAAAAVAGSGCGGDEPAQAGGPQGLGGGGIEGLQGASCQDWVRAPNGDRLATLRLLEEVVSGPRDEGRTLPSDEAYDLFERACGSGPGQGLLLYEVYIRAVAFDPLR
jgi:hypothetical protein